MIIFKYNILKSSQFLFFYKINKEKDTRTKLKPFHPLFSCFLTVVMLASIQLNAQIKPNLSLWEPSPAPHLTRIKLTGITAGVTYVGTWIAMNQLWYNKYEKSPFHFFDDTGEWNNIDKWGHAFATYFISEKSYSILRWTGIQKKNALLMGAGMGLLSLSIIEVLDGFSSGWGFSLADFGSNILGATLFTGQQYLFDKQIMRIKFSAFPVDYPTIKIYPKGGGLPVSLQERAHQLYGSTPLQQFLKDYNSQTIWITLNLKKLGAKIFSDNFPSWLTIAAGIGASNLYGGFKNEWLFESLPYLLDLPGYERKNQFYLAPDIDFSLLPVKSRGLKTLLQVLNAFKFPTPALEISSDGKTFFHLIYF